MYQEILGLLRVAFGVGALFVDVWLLVVSAVLDIACLGPRQLGALGFPFSCLIRTHESQLEQKGS